MPNQKKKIAGAAVHSLKQALTNVFWYKSDLRSFLSNVLKDRTLLSGLNWNDYKRNIVATLVDHLVRHEDAYQSELLNLMYETAKITDFSHLTQLDDGDSKAEKARLAVSALQKQLKGHQDLIREKRDIEIRRERAHQEMLQKTAVRDQLANLNREYLMLLSKGENPQMRGFRLEKILKSLFELFDLDPKASFKIQGEQIDGAFTFENTDYLLECKWQTAPVSTSDLDSLSSKLQRKLDNTLGLFLSINGYSAEAVATVSTGRRTVILMDGSDLMAVLEGRIDLVQLLARKRRAAAETGNIYLKIHEILRN